MKTSGMKTKRVALVVGLSGALGLGAFGGIVLPSAVNAQESPQAAEASALTEYELNTIEVVQNYGSSVVSINVAVSGQMVDPFSEGPIDPNQIPPQLREFFEQFGLPGGPGGGQGQTPPSQPREQTGSGSGFVVNQEGRIVTNFHVVEGAVDRDSLSSEQGISLREGASLTVTFQDDPDAELPVQIVGINPDYDLALLELENPGDLPDGVQPIPIANSDEVQVGQKVIAIGNPFAFSFTVTTGIVSAIDREGRSFIGTEIPFIQTDAAINPGNSGGPLLNSSGELIGINNAIYTPSGGFAGIGFAVPSNLLNESLIALEEGGLSGQTAQLQSPDRPVVGIVSQFSVEDYPESLREFVELPESGAVVTAVSPGSPAAEAGLQAAQFSVNAEGEAWPVGGDVITAIDGQAVANLEDMQRIILERQAGDTVEVTLWNRGEERQVSVTLVAQGDLE